MAKKEEEPYILVKMKSKRKYKEPMYEDENIRRRKIQKQNLRVLGKKRKKTKSEEDEEYSIYTGSYFEFSADRPRSKPFKLEIILLIDRTEMYKNRCTCLSIEEWNGKSHSRSLVKRCFYRNKEGEWRPGKSTGLKYIDLQHILKPTKEGERIRKDILDLLAGPVEDEED